MNSDKLHIVETKRKDEELIEALAKELITVYRSLINFDPGLENAWQTRIDSLKELIADS